MNALNQEQDDILARVRGIADDVIAERSCVASAGHGDGYVVSTRSPQSSGPTDTVLYLVTGSDPGLSASGPWDALGLRGNASAPMRLTDCVIPSDRALCEPGKGF